MTDPFPMLIPDATSDDGELEVRTPYDGSVIGRITAADTGAIERAHANAFGLFGPVICLYSYTEIDQAIQQANYDVQ